MRCPSCNHDNSVDASFCDACGAKLESICATCGTTNQPGARFCKKCGTRIATESAPAKPAAASTAPKVRVTPEQAEASSLEGERKTVTALFADIKGSTELEQDLDPEEARAIIDPALKLMMDAVHRYDGYIPQSTGDGIFALFGAPVAHEDHPQRALKKRGRELGHQLCSVLNAVVSEIIVQFAHCPGVSVVGTGVVSVTP